MPNHTRKANDLDKKSHTAEGTVDSSGMDMGDWSGSETVTLLSGVTDAPPPIQEEEELKKKQPWSHPFSPSFSQFSPTSPAGLVLDRFLCTARLAEQAYHSTGLPPEPYELSPSLVALEMNSEEEDDDFLMKKPLPQISLDHKSNGEDEDRIKGASDFTCIGSHSNAFPFNHTSLKDSGDQGVRLRSYSYSAPKISLLPPCFCRDAQPPPNHFSNEQQTFSLTEQPQEKREVRLHRRSQSADDETSVELADSLQHLTLSEFLKEMEEEEWDRYIIPSNTESEKHRVSRTFSFIKSCMYSTRNKSKGKSKDKEAKEKQANDEQPATGGAPGPAACEVRDHLAAGEESLHSSNCTVTFHKGCKDSALQCLKKVQEKYAVSTVKTRAATLPQNFIVRESSSSSVMPVSASLPVMTVKDSKDSVPMLSPLSRSVPLVPDRFTESTERKSHSSAWRTNVQTDEILQTMESTSTDSSLMEDAVDVSLHIMVGADTLGLEVESWSLAVESWFCQGQEKYTIKRQDIIYELMQTELHHLQTLTIMAEVFRRGMRDEVGLDAHTIGRIFPCLDELLLLHKDFLSALRDRRQSSTQPDSDRNYLIHRVGDVLMHQFTQENAKNMKQVYGEFCSHHNEAVSFFKELQQQNKKFQLFIKQQSSNSLVKRREIPECILLVTQRITKYPVLLERILQYTEEGTVEHRELRAALAGVRELLSAVNVQVSEREQSQRLRDVLARMEAKSMMRLEGGLTFRKQDLASGRTLLHHGPLLWKTATGRLKDVLALLLTDLLIFLQEKDQKFIFAAVDQKPPVISLQKLIVREVANEERGMFLICTSSARPEMYEVHAISKDERNAWMSLIREAVMICHEKEDETASESEEEKRAAEAKVQNIHKLQETLCGQDQLICSSLEEKLQIYAELSAMSGGGTTGSEPRLLVRPGAGEPPHATALLTAALREAETLRAALLARCTSSTSPSSMPVLREPSTLDTSTSVKTLPPAPPPPPLSPEREPQLVDTPRDEEEEMVEEENTDLQAQNHSFTPNDHNLHLKVCQSVQSLTQLLYSLQAAITIQDSCYEVERLLLLLLSSPAHPHPCAGPTMQERQREVVLGRQREVVLGRQREGVLGRQREVVLGRLGRRRHEELEGTAGASLVEGTAGASLVEGTVGASLVEGTVGASLVEGTAGASLVEGTAGASLVEGPAGALERHRQHGEREWQAWRVQQGAREDALHLREQHCHLEAQQLQREHEELREQLHDHQQSLERLHEGQRSVEQQRRILDAQRRLLQACPPTTLISLDGQQGPSFNHGHFSGQDEQSSNFVNEAVMVTMNNRHLHRHHQRCHPSSNHGYGDSPSAQNSLNSLLAWSSCTLATCGMAHTLDKIEGKAGQQEVALPNQAQEAWSPEVTGVGFYQGTTLSVPTASFSMEMEKRDAEGEDNIVYL